jgi:putative membrane protein
MVKVLSQEAKDAIESAVCEAEKRTAAEIVVVVVPASDSYQEYVLLFGVVLGALLGLGLWHLGVIASPLMLLLPQLITIVVMSVIPFFRLAVVRLVPRTDIVQHASERASHEFLTISEKVSSSTPIVLLYVSVWEHYVKIVSSRSISEKIPAAPWDDVAAGFKTSVRQGGLKDACVEAISRIANIVSPAFPENGTAQGGLPNDVIVH